MTTLKKVLCLSLVACGCCALMTGCGNNKKTSTSGNNNNNNNAVENAADNVGNAAQDVVNGAENAVEDLVGANGFNNYEDAHTYFMNTMGNYHSDAKFEIRDEDRNLADYQEGSKGYHFKLYDTSKNTEGELFGEFYVDADTGVIYKVGENNQFIEYRGTETNNAGTTNGTTNGTANGTTNNTTNGTTNGTTNNNTNGATSGTTTGTAGNAATAR